jgi:hypothetical protein
MANLVWALAIQESSGGGGGNGLAMVLLNLIPLMFWVLPVALSFILGVMGLVLLAASWRLFTKAGEPGWAAIVPIYGFIVLLKISSMPWWWLFLFPIALLIMPFKLAANFGQGTGFAVGLLMLFPIFLPMLAFGSAQYRPVA